MRVNLAQNAKIEAPRAARKQPEPKTDASLDIALINNMPESAFAATERQFGNLLRAAAGRMPLRLHLFTLRRDLPPLYGSLRDLLGGKFDGAIVTGKEPIAPRLQEEESWSDLVRVIEWAQRNTSSTVWSCLAAHAAVLHLDGIERERLPQKLSGVYANNVTEPHPLIAGLKGPIHTPHSRYNALSDDDLVARGYRILTGSLEAGADTFIRDGRSLFLFFQGHPEYETDTLLREYRRDVGRYLRGERDVYPPEPEPYFNPEALAILRAFRRRALAHRSAELMDVFPNVASPFAITNSWAAGATRIYRNWLAELRARKQGLADIKS